MGAILLMSTEVEQTVKLLAYRSRMNFLGFIGVCKRLEIRIPLAIKRMRIRVP